MFKQTANLKKALFILFVISALGLTGGLCQAQETVTITTYYPAPYGAYRNLRVIPSAAAPPCDAANEGSVYFSSATHKLFVCQQLWVPSSGTYGPYGWGGTFWAQQSGSNNIYAAISGSVGIGVIAPATTPPNGSSGNLDANDVYIRSISKWVSQMGVTIPPPSTLWTSDNNNADCPNNTYACGFDCTGGCDTGSMRIRCCYFN
jgi:hypothetical protein